MNFVLKSSLMSLALVCGTAMATNFSGPELGASVTMISGTSLVDLKSSNNYDGDYGQQSIGFKLHGGYGFDMGNDTVVFVGFDYNPTDIKAGSNDGDSIAIKNSWSLSLAPGLKLNESSLAYVKVAYESGKFSYKGSSYSIEETLSGFGYGAGLRTEINKTTFLETEIKQVKYEKFTYKSAADFTPSATVGSVGLVFKF